MSEPDRYLRELRRSHDHLRFLVEPLDGEALRRPSYASEWTVADVLSHLGSGAEIALLRLDAALAGGEAPSTEVVQDVWSAWNAKTPEQKAADGLVADGDFLRRAHALTPEERERFQTSLGPMTLNLADFLALRLSEHVVHTWDIAVAFDLQATLPAEAVELLLPTVRMITAFVGKPIGRAARYVVSTTQPLGRHAVELSESAVTLSADGADTPADITMPSEALVRLVYGRLDPGHTPFGVAGAPDALTDLRRAFPGL